MYKCDECFSGPNVEEVNHVVLPPFLLGPLHMIVSLTINAAQFDSVLKSLDQN